MAITQLLGAVPIRRRQGAAGGSGTGGSVPMALSAPGSGAWGRVAHLPRVVAERSADGRHQRGVGAFEVAGPGRQPDRVGPRRGPPTRTARARLRWRSAEGAPRRAPARRTP